MLSGENRSFSDRPEEERPSVSFGRRQNLGEGGADVSSAFEPRLVAPSNTGGAAAVAASLPEPLRPPDAELPRGRPGGRGLAGEVAAPMAIELIA